MGDILKIGIYGGSFNPPHLGHEFSAAAAIDQLMLDLLFIIPTGIPPHKNLPAETPPVDKRLHMAQLAFSKTRNAIVSEIEIRNKKPSYTIDTVLAIKKDYPGAELYLLTGTDMFLTLDTWKDSGLLLNTVIPIVFSRSSDDLEKIAGYSARLKSQYGVSTEIVANKVVDISSSLLRSKLPRREGAGYIDDTIYSYIIKSRIYDAKPDWGWLRSKAYSMLAPSRIPHVEGCEFEAVRLSERWGVDADDAREAAILHDITKRLSPEENLEILEKRDLSFGVANKNEEKLLHSKSGAALAKTEFGVSDSVADAITWHTTGRPNMSSLEKVVYIADYIEPTRDFDGVGRLRELAYEDLDMAVKAGLEMSIEDMRSRGIIPNRTTFDALTYIITEGATV